MTLAFLVGTRNFFGLFWLTTELPYLVPQELIDDYVVIRILH